MSSSPHSPVRSRLLLCALLCATVATPPLRAEDPPAKEISEKVSEKFGEIRPLIDGKKYPEAIKLLDSLIAEIKMDSYDFVVLAQMKAQILLTMGDVNGAADPLEKCLAVGEKYGFLDPKSIYDQLSMLSQIYYQKAIDQKDPAAQHAGYTKAYEFVSRAIKAAPKPSVDLQLFAASVLYNQGSLGATPDPEKFKQSIVEAQKGLHLAIKPPEQLYQLMLASLQQLNEMEQATELLELMLESKPKSAQPWQQLVALYMTLAGKSKEDSATLRYNLRAILSIERAQALGFLSSPRENYTLVALYFTIQQFGRAAQLLEKGLKDGSIESQRRNWEMLANAYQQMNQEMKAIEALQRATTVFPKEGQLEFTMSQLYYGQGKIDEAYRHSLNAATKGQLEKPGQAYLYVAYLGYELKKFEDALKWIEQAEKQPDIKPADIAQIKNAITNAVKEREALLAPTKA